MPKNVHKRTYLFIVNPCHFDIKEHSFFTMEGKEPNISHWAWSENAEIYPLKGLTRPLCGFVSGEPKVTASQVFVNQKCSNNKANLYYETFIVTSSK